MVYIYIRHDTLTVFAFGSVFATMYSHLFSAFLLKSQCFCRSPFLGSLLCLHLSLV